jgi:hypothetical protein
LEQTHDRIDDVEQHIPAPSQAGERPLDVPM